MNDDVSLKERRTAAANIFRIIQFSLNFVLFSSLRVSQNHNACKFLTWSPESMIIASIKHQVLNASLTKDLI